MSNLMHQHPNSGYSLDGHWWHDLNVYLNSQNVGANTSNVTVEIVVYSDSGSVSQSGSWVGQLWVNSVLWANTTSSHSVSNGAVQIAVASSNVGHDANGNCTLSVEYFVNEPVTSMSRRGASWGLSRLALAPSILGDTADTIKPTSVRLGTELNNYGHGTSAATHILYRLQGAGSWSQTADAGDVAGYNYFNITGLKPGKTYEYASVWWNNNGDTVTNGASTFKTKGVPGMAPVLMALA